MASKYVSQDVEFSSPQSSYCQRGLSAWRRRSVLEQCLVIVTVVFVIAVMALSIALGSKKSNVVQVTNPGSSCSRSDCINIASDMISAMDQSQDPCQDFYQYACGNWPRDHPVPDGQLWTENLGKDNSVILRDALNSVPPNATEAERKAKAFYDSCMNLKVIDSLGISPFMDRLQSLNDSSKKPLDAPWSQVGYKWNLQAVMEELDVYSLSPLGLSVTVDPTNSSRYLLTIANNDCLNLDDFGGSASLQNSSAMLDYMTTVQVLLGRPEKESRQLMAEVINVESQLANAITVGLAPNESDSYQWITLKDFQSSVAPIVNWITLLRRTFSVTNYTITDNEIVLTTSSQKLVFSQLAGHIFSMMQNSTTSRILYAYLEWQLIEKFTSAMPKSFREALRTLNIARRGTEGDIPRWKTCLQYTELSLGFAVGRMYIKAAFSDQARQYAKQMVTSVQIAMSQRMKDEDWMDSTTKNNALQKLAAITHFIGYPDFILDDKALDAKYAQLSVNSTSFFENLLNSLKVCQDRKLWKLRTVPMRNEWLYPPQTINANYQRSVNSITIYAGILQPRTFKVNYPSYVNYGAMGSVIGHEFTHGFDNTGRTYDAQGNFREWWTDSSLTNFNKKAQCFVDQYSQFKLGDGHVDGNLTLGENIADNGGLKAAFNAYVAYLTTNGPEANLPGLNLTSEQLFFLAFAQSWCINYTPYAIPGLLRDVHSPHMFRVRGTLANSADFSKAYSCPTGTTMNPKTKCQLW